MDGNDHSALKKALAINLEASIYGTFAEIGAGQEVARNFFQAGKASQTIAKTMSAYDMTFSDAIYGKTSRYVCEERLIHMLDHEYDLLQERLKAQRGESCSFFAFADTVATSSHDEPSPRCHGWMGIRYQSSPGGPPNDIILHVRLLDRQRLQQQEALGILGVNLVHLAFFRPDDYADIVLALEDNLGSHRIEINLLKFSGPDVKGIDNRLLSLEMVRQNLTNAILFSPEGTVLNPSDALFKKSILIQRGTYRPITKSNLQVLEKAHADIRKIFPKALDPMILLEITMNNLLSEGELNTKDFLDRVDTLCSLGHHVLFSNLKLFYQVKGFLRNHTDQMIMMIIGASHLEKIFDPKFYERLPGGILEGFSRLFDSNTKILVHPYKTDQLCQTATTFNPGKGLKGLYSYFLENDLIHDISDCDDVEASIHSRDVRDMLAKGNSEWEKLVPEPVRKLIKNKRLFGYQAEKST